MDFHQSHLILEKDMHLNIRIMEGIRQEWINTKVDCSIRLGRLATVGDICPLMGLLLSDAALYIPGQFFTVDSGLTCVKTDKSVIQ